MRLQIMAFFATQFCLGELGSYILRDTPEPSQLNAPGPRMTIEGNRCARKGNRWPGIKGTDVGPELASTLSGTVNGGGAQMGGTLFLCDLSKQMMQP